MTRALIKTSVGKLTNGPRANMKRTPKLVMVWYRAPVRPLISGSDTSAVYRGTMTLTVPQVMPRKRRPRRMVRKLAATMTSSQPMIRGTRKRNMVVLRPKCCTMRPEGMAVKAAPRA